MKKVLSIISVLFITILVSAQTFPVAVNDYVNIEMEESITVNVTANDYHPDGLNFRVFSADGALSFTDSTITYPKFDYDTYYNAFDTIKRGYRLIDEEGKFGYESFGKVKITLDNQNSFDFLEINNIRARIQPSGTQFWGGPGIDIPSYEFPKGSGKHSMFNTALWIGGLDEANNLRLAAERYRQWGHDYWPGPVSVDGGLVSTDTSTVLDWYKVWNLTKEEVVYHRLHWNDFNYMPTETISTWPAHGDPDLNQAQYLAPFVDVDGDSIYDPGNGDYPLIRGDQCVFFIINDVRTHTETGGDQIGLEIHGMAYQFLSDEILPLNNTVFLSYKVFNRSPFTINDCYIGVFSDIDLGYAYDDYVGCDVERGAYFAYNGVEIDGNGEPEAYGENPPAQGVVILGGPTMDGNGVDDPDDQCDESINGVGFGDDIADNERYGMTSFVYYNNTNSATGDPTIAQEYYTYMQGIWKDGTSMEYGGNGHVSSGAYGPAANFMFPGLTDPCYWGTNGEEPYGPVEWTEETAGNIPSDRRGLSAMGPFTFEAGSMERIDLAFVGAFPEDDQTSVETLMEYIDIVKGEYYQDPTYFGYQWLGVDDEKVENHSSINAYPNPTDNILTFSCDYISSKGNYSLSNLMGKVVDEGIIEKNEIITIDLNNLTSGIYIISITDDKNMYYTKIIKK